MSLVHQPQEAELVEDADLSSMSLDELAASANAEHRLVLQSVEEASSVLTVGLVHGIRCGEILVAIRQHLTGGWKAWADANLEVSYGVAARYIRWFTYRDVIMDAATPLSTETVNDYLTRHSLPAVKGTRSLSSAQDAEIQRLHLKGLGPQEIAGLDGCTREAVRQRLDPQVRAKAQERSRRYARRQQEAKKALAEKEKANAIRKAGGNISNAYSFVRKAAAELDAALGDATSPEVRTALRAALAGVHKAEDEIGKAVRSQ